MRIIEAPIYLIEINEKGIECTCYACPTQFKFTDTEGTAWYFRLRHGHWHLENFSTREVVCSGLAPDGVNGMCDVDDMLDMARKQNYHIVAHGEMKIYINIMSSIRAEEKE